MIIYFFNLIISILQYNLHSSILFVMFIFFVISIYLLFKKKNYKDYKIYNFFVNNIFIGIYLSIFIIGILILRYYRWGYNFDLLENLKFIKEFFYNNSLLGNINWFLILIIIFLLIMKIKNFLYYQIKKRHIYYYNKSYYNTYKYFVNKQKREPLDIEFSYYVIFIKKLSKLTSRWSYNRFHWRIISFIVYSPYNILKIDKNYKDSKLIFYFIKILTFLFKIFPYFLFIFLIFFDIYYNKYQIQLIFYYLPIFFIYQTWKNISQFLSKNNFLIDHIIYDLYYESERFYYIDLLEEEYKFILTYIENNFVCFTENPPLSKYKNKNDWYEYSQYIDKCVNDILLQKYVILDCKSKIKNYYTLEELETKDILTIETKPLLKRIKKLKD